MKMISMKIIHFYRGIIIVNRKKIALNYLKGWFFIDFVSTFPVYLIMDSL